MGSSELDGKYLVSTTTNYQGPFEKKSDGETQIVNGQTNRRDEANCLWTSTFTILSEEEVEMVSVADPYEADDDFALTRPDGTPTSDAVTYSATLKMNRKGDKIQLSGKIRYGTEIVFITMRRIGDVEG